MIDAIAPENRLLLNAVAPDGSSAATGIFVGRPNGLAVFWMGGSDARHHRVLPNEALMWHAMRTLRDRGMTALDFGGGGIHKAKYGGRETVVPWIRRSRWSWLELPRARLARHRRSRPRAR